MDKGETLPFVFLSLDMRMQRLVSAVFDGPHIHPAIAL